MSDCCEVKPVAKKVTVKYLKEAKSSGEKLTMLTAYDFPTAAAMDAAGVDMILVGDSLGMVVLGYDSTIPVTMEDMIHHTKPVVRAAQRAMVIGDMPFMSYQISRKEAMRNAGRFLQEAGADAVKLEGGEEIAKTTAAIVEMGVPVIGHLGLTPQSVNVFGGWQLQAEGVEAAEKLVADAVVLEKAGCCAIVLEKIPAPVAKIVTETIGIPTISIGAGPDCDGQVLVSHDVLGLFEKFTPKFSKRYAEFGAEMRNAFEAYVKDVKAGTFPADEHSFPADPTVIKALTESAKTRKAKES